MAKNILVPIAQGTEEMEAVIIIDMLRRANLNVIVAGENNIITCSHGVKIIPEIYFTDILEDDIYDAIVLPGGRNGVEELCNNVVIADVLRLHYERNGIIAAICAAPLLLRDLRILPKNVKVTSYPTFKKSFSEDQYSENSVVVSGRFITSRAAGTAFDFALQLIEILADTDTANRIKNDILYKN